MSGISKARTYDSLSDADLAALHPARLVWEAECSALYCEIEGFEDLEAFIARQIAAGRKILFVTVGACTLSKVVLACEYPTTEQAKAAFLALLAAFKEDAVEPRREAFGRVCAAAFTARGVPFDAGAWLRSNSATARSTEGDS